MGASSKELSECLRLEASVARVDDVGWKFPPDITLRAARQSSRQSSRHRSSAKVTAPLKDSWLPWQLPLPRPPTLSQEALASPAHSQPQSEFTPRRASELTPRRANMMISPTGSPMKDL